MYGKGISREGLAPRRGGGARPHQEVGAWFTYEGEQLGQGRENVKVFLRENPQLMAEIDERVREALAPEVEKRMGQSAPLSTSIDPPIYLRRTDQPFGLLSNPLASPLTPPCRRRIAPATATLSARSPLSRGGGQPVWGRYRPCLAPASRQVLPGAPG